MRKLFLAACLVLLASGISFARDGKKSTTKATPAPAPSAGKIGVGFNSQLGNINSVALRYWGAENVGFEGIFGFAFGDNKVLDIGGKIIAVAKKEQNLNLYGFGLVGIDNTTTKTANPITGLSEDKSDTNFIVNGGFGVEFFFPGLPNLGFLTELGIGYHSGTKTFGTSADWITSAGVRYYL